MKVGRVRDYLNLVEHDAGRQRRSRSTARRATW